MNNYLTIEELANIPQVKNLIEALEDMLIVGEIALSWCPERDKYKCYMQKIENNAVALAPFKKYVGE